MTQKLRQCDCHGCQNHRIKKTEMIAFSFLGSENLISKEQKYYPVLVLHLYCHKSPWPEGIYMMSRILAQLQCTPLFPGSRPWFNIKMMSYQYEKSHCGDKTILRPSYLRNGISYTGKTRSLYWIRAQVIFLRPPIWNLPRQCHITIDQIRNGDH